MTNLGLTGIAVVYNRRRLEHSTIDPNPGGRVVEIPKRFSPETACCARVCVRKFWGWGGCLAGD